MGIILIVEDNKTIATGLKKLIESVDSTHKIVMTGYSKEAFSFALKHRVDAFFLDIQLKDYNGMKLAKELRSQEAYKFTPIVFITAVPSRELEAFKQIHCYEYIIKPFEEEEVREVIETILNHGMAPKVSKSYIKMVQKEFTHVIDQDTIIYVEARNRKIIFKTLDDELTFSTYTLAEVYNELTDQFIQCHRSYIVNKRYIKLIDKKNSEIKLYKTVIPIPYSRSYKEEVLEVYL